MAEPLTRDGKENGTDGKNERKHRREQVESVLKLAKKVKGNYTREGE